MDQRSRVQPVIPLISAPAAERQRVARKSESREGQVDRTSRLEDHEDPRGVEDGPSPHPIESSGGCSLSSWPSVNPMTFRWKAVGGVPATSGTREEGEERMLGWVEVKARSHVG